MTLQHKWNQIQEFLDIKGDVIMLGYTTVIIYKTISHGLTSSDAIAYSAAVGTFGYSKGKKCKQEPLNES